jgi:hypothetical protein
MIWVVDARVRRAQRLRQGLFGRAMDSRYVYQPPGARERPGGGEVVVAWLMVWGVVVRI